MRIITLLLLFAAILDSFSQVPKTTFELSKGQATGTYTMVIDYYKSLAQSYPEIQIQEIGSTDSGQPLHLVTLDPSGQFDYEQAHNAGKIILLINNGIHPGEPDGIEASQMLLRDYVMHKNKIAKIKNVVIGIIPIYNIGGALNRNTSSRVNQEGPEAYGFRGNARNYDLNRDFIKADTKNTHSFHELFHHVNPDIFIDTHVSNGADYQYTITHLMTQHNKMGGELGRFIAEELTPKLEGKMKESNTPITPYVNVYNTPPDEEGFSQFLDHPRYSTGYTTLFNTVGLMIETHMLKTFKTRVESTYTMLEAMIEIANEDGEKIRQLRGERQQELIPGSTYPLNWEVDSNRHTAIAFKGYEASKTTSQLTGQPRLTYNRRQPYQKNIPYYNTFVPTQQIIIAKAYITPQGWHQVITLLKHNQATYRILEQDTSMLVEVYSIVDYTTSHKVYEGHYRNNPPQLTTQEKRVAFRKGDYVFPTTQPAVRYLIETLEPQAADSFFSWNFFDTILQQKEGFSPYVFEDLALQLIQDDPQLKKTFDEKKKNDSDFASNGYAQLDYIYKNSQYHEPSYMRYPIYRLVK